jgi:hypothetical protein
MTCAPTADASNRLSHGERHLDVYNFQHWLRTCRPRGQRGQRPRCPTLPTVPWTTLRVAHMPTASTTTNVSLKKSGERL